MKLALLLAIGLLVPSAEAGKKKKKDEAPEAPAAEADAGGLSGDFPADKNSQAFAEKLVALQISEFRAVDGAGANVVFDKMSFEGDNSWSADGYTDFGDEGKMECKESGTWSMETATSKTEATVVWKVDETDCVGREAGVETRMAVELTGDGWKVAFR